jgi:hypothetical protein
MSGKRKSKSRSAFGVKNLTRKKNIEEKSDLVSRFDKGEGIVDRYCNVRLSHISVCMIHDNYVDNSKINLRLTG